MRRKTRKASGTRRPDIWLPFWRRRGVGLVFLLVLATVILFERFGLFGGPGGREQPAAIIAGTDHDRYNNRTFTCIKVIDGDTLYIDAPDGNKSYTSVRLIGVDTPEVDESLGRPTYFGAEASAFTRSQAEGKPVRIVLKEKETRDRFRRLLAYVYLGDGTTMLNEEIIAQGYGYAYTTYPHPWTPRFIDLERRARKQKRGLWKEVTTERMPQWRRKLEEPR
ncbi:MAG TPA: thermonuclease family protein [Phycisphaerae bacterium]|nr:thermonuclease family protein [Phycisphaerae bacterium]HRR85950.1 thermonuclease family protein [Phycisphaerae bacterium]